MVFRNTLLIIAAVLFLVTVLVNTNFGAGRTVIYDCRLSEFHPDFPPSVKEECRKLIRDSIQTKRITT